MGLRLTEGVDLAAMSSRFALPPAGLVDEGALDRLTALGLLWREGSRIGVAPPGRGLLDALLAEVVADTLVEA
jgi:Coproporphyrinogen III oxidase and related Fe-S oxidoreductases